MYDVIDLYVRSASSALARRAVSAIGVRTKRPSSSSQLTQSSLPLSAISAPSQAPKTKALCFSTCFVRIPGYWLMNPGNYLTMHYLTLFSVYGGVRSRPLAGRLAGSERGADRKEAPVPGQIGPSRQLDRSISILTSANVRRRNAPRRWLLSRPRSVL